MENKVSLESFLERCKKISRENEILKKENELLKEELKELTGRIDGLYNTMISLEVINKKEIEDIEEI